MKLFLFKPLRSSGLWLLALALFIIHFATAFAGPVESLHQDLIALSSDETVQETALARLKARPESEITAAIGPMLESPSTLVFALRALRSLGLTSFTAKLREIAKTSNLPEIFDSLSADGDASLKDLYKIRLEALTGQKKNSALKVSLLDGLAKFGIDIGDKTFTALLSDDDYLVREATIRQFLASRENVPHASQIARFKAAFHAKPFQARVIANSGYAALSLIDRQALQAAFDGNACARDAHAEVRRSCEDQTKR